MRAYQPRGVDDHRLAPVIERVDADGAGARDDRLEAFDAQAAFVEFHKFIAQLQARIGNDVEGDGSPLGCGRFCRVLYYSQLQG